MVLMETSKTQDPVVGLIFKGEESVTKLLRVIPWKDSIRTSIHHLQNFRLLEGRSLVTAIRAGCTESCPLGDLACGKYLEAIPRIIPTSRAAVLLWLLQRLP